MVGEDQQRDSETKREEESPFVGDPAEPGLDRLDRFGRSFLDGGGFLDRGDAGVAGYLNRGVTRDSRSFHGCLAGESGAFDRSFARGGSTGDGAVLLRSVLTLTGFTIFPAVIHCPPSYRSPETACVWGALGVSIPQIAE